MKKTLLVAVLALTSIAAFAALTQPDTALCAPPLCSIFGIFCC